MLKSKATTAGGWLGGRQVEQKPPAEFKVSAWAALSNTESPQAPLNNFAPL